MIRPFLFSAFFLIYSISHAQAGAWLQTGGRGQFILTSRYYQSDERFDNRAERIAQNRYRKYEINPYLEYGLLPNLTIGLNTSIQSASRENATSGRAVSLSLGDTELFARTPLMKRERWVISASPLLKIPSPQSRFTTPKIGADKPDVGLGILTGYSFSAFGRDHFADTGVTYRYRFGEPENQWNLSATLGVRISPTWMVMPQVFTTLRAKKPKTTLFTQSSADDYDVTTLQLSGVYALDPRRSLQAGVFSDMAGRNAGAGQGIFIALWQNF